MQCSENTGRFSRGAIFSRPQRRQTDSQRPRELCLTNPECATQADEGIVGAIEFPETDPRNLFPHHLTLIECISLSRRFRLSKVMTNRKKQASIMRTTDNRLKATARAVISPRIQRGVRVVGPQRPGFRDLGGGDDEAPRIDIVGPAGEDREANVRGGSQDLDGRR
jgi:hypothetical protein